MHTALDQKETVVRKYRMTAHRIL